MKPANFQPDPQGFRHLPVLPQSVPNPPLERPLNGVIPNTGMVRYPALASGADNCCQSWWVGRRIQAPHAKAGLLSNCSKKLMGEVEKGSPPGEKKGFQPRRTSAPVIKIRIPGAGEPGVRYGRKTRGVAVDLGTGQPVTLAELMGVEVLVTNDPGSTGR